MLKILCFSLRNLQLILSSMINVQCCLISYLTWDHVLPDAFYFYLTPCLLFSPSFPVHVLGSLCWERNHLYSGRPSFQQFIQRSSQSVQLCWSGSVQQSCCFEDIWWWVFWSSASSYFLSFTFNRISESSYSFFSIYDAHSHSFRIIYSLSSMDPCCGCISLMSVL